MLAPLGGALGHLGDWPAPSPTAPKAPPSRGFGVNAVLGVGPSQVVPFGQALDRWLSVQRPVRSSVVVVVEEAGQGGSALAVGGVDAAVGPAQGERLDEAFCFAVGAGPVGLGEEVLEPEPATDRGVGV